DPPEASRVGVGLGLELDGGLEAEGAGVLRKQGDRGLEGFPWRRGGRALVDALRRGGGETLGDVPVGIGTGGSDQAPSVVLAERALPEVVDPGGRGIVVVKQHHPDRDPIGRAVVVVTKLELLVVAPAALLATVTRLLLLGLALPTQTQPLSGRRRC